MMKDDTMLMDGGEYARLSKQAIEEKLQADLHKALHDKYGENPDPIIVERMDRELAALREQEGADLAAACALSGWLKAHGAAFFVEHSTASGLIPYLLGLTQTNPLPPHTLCPNCKKIRWHCVKDGFDIPPATCADCGTYLIRDGHDLIWQEYASYGRVPNYGFGLPGAVREQICSWLKQ